MKKIKVFILSIVLLGSYGCGTLAGATKGAGEDIQAAGKGVAHAWAALKRADAWVQKNLW